jgi:hypothetical protein
VSNISLEITESTLLSSNNPGTNAGVDSAPFFDVMDGIQLSTIKDVESG